MRLIPPRSGQRRSSPARQLYEAAVLQARAPALYVAMGAPDTVEGRFEVLTLHIILLTERLASPGAEAALGQALFDTYLRDLDGAMREMGVGDLVMGKRMRALGQVFYGRAQAFRTALDALPDQAPLRSALGRTLYESSPPPELTAMVDYVMRCRQRLAGAELAQLAAGLAPWPEP